MAGVCVRRTRWASPFAVVGKAVPERTISSASSTFTPIVVHLVAEGDELVDGIMRR